jgi:hypothetical protein
MAKARTGDRRRFNMPPEAHRWQKGCPSPNPKGRPRKPSLEQQARDSLRRSMEEKIAVNGQLRSAFEVGVLQVRNKALQKGDIRALRQWLELLREFRLLVADSEGFQGGVLVVPAEALSNEEWERDFGGDKLERYHEKLRAAAQAREERQAAAPTSGTAAPARLSAPLPAVPKAEPARLPPSAPARRPLPAPRPSC